MSKELRARVIENVKKSNLSEEDKQCIIEVFERFEKIERSLMRYKEKSIKQQSHTKFHVINNASIADIGLTLRTYNCLMRAGIKTVQDIADRFDDLPKVRNLGQRSYDEIIEKIKPYIEE